MGDSIVEKLAAVSKCIVDAYGAIEDILEERVTGEPVAGRLRDALSYLDRAGAIIGE